MMVYDPAAGGMILFGGFFYFEIPHGVTIQVAYNQTWLFANNTWTNITASVGDAPSPRWSGAMSYDPSDNYILLFGGATAYGNALGDTWKLSDGTWTNITASEGGASGYLSQLAPEPRAGAAVANSPSGYVMLFGGMDKQANGSTDIIQNWCQNGSYENEGNSTVAWWFYHGKWSPMNGWGDTETGPCTPIIKRPHTPEAPTPAASTLVPNPPCGRVDPALGWSPKNAQFVLYGGYGSTVQTTNSVCSGGPAMLNDTWLYGNVSGGGYVWHVAGDSGDPHARAYMGYASDFTDDYFEIFGGELAGGSIVNQTWRFFEYVHAKLTGPDSYNTAPGIHLLSNLFTVLGYGGSGDLTYTLTQKELKTDNSLVSSCGQFNGAAHPLPYNGTVAFHCSPGVGAYNVYRLTLTVTDVNQTSDFATSIWIFYVLPPESMNIYSEYVSYFYQTVAVHNTFTIYAVVAGLPATGITARLGDRSVTFAQSSNPKYWNATVNMSGVAQGAILHAEATWGNWTQNATYNVTMIAFPGWLQNVIQTNGPNETFQSFGAGPFNKTYSVNDSYSWNIASGFSLPIELLGGDYNMIPSLGVNFTVTSMGYLSINGTLPLTSTSIDLGPASLSLSVGLSLLGTFDVVDNSIHWVKAVATITISAGLGEHPDLRVRHPGHHRRVRPRRPDQRHGGAQSRPRAHHRPGGRHPAGRRDHDPEPPGHPHARPLGGGRFRDRHRLDRAGRRRIGRAIVLHRTQLRHYRRLGERVDLRHRVVPVLVRFVEHRERNDLHVGRSRGGARLRQRKHDDLGARRPILQRHWVLRHERLVSYPDKRSGGLRHLPVHGGQRRLRLTTGPTCSTRTTTQASRSRRA